jgi:DNA-binding beta-propeller fold protein YncE
LFRPCKERSSLPAYIEPPPVLAKPCALPKKSLGMTVLRLVQPLKNDRVYTVPNKEIMQGDMRSRALRARGFAAPWAVLALAAGPFASVAHETSANVAVLATAIRAMAATVAVEDFPSAVAVAPDGTKVCVANKSHVFADSIGVAAHRRSVLKECGADQ